jgi:hypothetical protein
VPVPDGRRRMGRRYGGAFRWARRGRVCRRRVWVPQMGRGGEGEGEPIRMIGRPRANLPPQHGGPGGSSNVCAFWKTETERKKREPGNATSRSRPGTRPSPSPLFGVKKARGEIGKRHGQRVREREGRPSQQVTRHKAQGTRDRPHRTKPQGRQAAKAAQRERWRVVVWHRHNLMKDKRMRRKAA